MVLGHVSVKWKEVGTCPHKYSLYYTALLRHLTAIPRHPPKATFPVARGWLRSSNDLCHLYQFSDDVYFLGTDVVLGHVSYKVCRKGFVSAVRSWSSLNC